MKQSPERRRTQADSWLSSLLTMPPRMPVVLRPSLDITADPQDTPAPFPSRLREVLVASSVDAYGVPVSQSENLAHAASIEQIIGTDASSQGTNPTSQ